MSNYRTYFKRIGVIIVVMVAMLGMASFGSDAATVSVKNSTGYVNSADGLTLREKASTSSKAVANLADNTKLTIKSEKFTSATSTASSKKWYYVTTGGMTGYVRSDYVDHVTHSSVCGKTTCKLTYREGAGSLMKKAGTFAKGEKIAVCRKACPYGSSAVWYRVKVDGKFRYVNSKYVELVEGSAPGASTFKPMTEAQFETYMTKQGFPESYKPKLRALHKAHPNWTFVAQQVGVKWYDAVTKEHADGVSLIQSVHPKSYRDLGSKSYTKGKGRTAYSKPSTGSSKVCTVADAADFTVLGVKEYKGTVYYKVKTSAGKVGFIKGAPTYMKFTKVKTGEIAKKANVRNKPTTTDSTVYTSYQPGTKVTVVAPAESSKGNGWYMIKYGGSFGFISAPYVKIDGEFKKINPDKPVTAAKSSDVVSAGAAPEADADTDATEAETVEASEEEAQEEAAEEPAAEPEVLDEPIEVMNLDEDQFVVANTSDEDSESDVDAVELFEDEQELIEACIDEEAENSEVNADVNTEVASEEAVIEDEETVETSDSEDLDDFVVLDDDDFIVLDEPVKKEIKAQATDTTTDKWIVAMTEQLGLGGTGKLIEGTFKAKDGSTWFNACRAVVAYYMDPRNFLNEDRIYMFETLSYSSYQTQATVEKVLAGTQFPKAGYKASWFYTYGKQYKISPVFLASRARQETGGGSVALTGYRINGVYYYNPFNIGAYSSANPVLNGMNYAKSQGWNTKEKAVKGGAKYLAGGYVSNNQDTLYTQKFNVGNGAKCIATHQYMTNIMAPYSESISVKNAYKSYGITNEQLVFKIPVYNDMPNQRKLP